MDYLPSNQITLTAFQPFLIQYPFKILSSYISWMSAYADTEEGRIPVAYKITNETNEGFTVTANNDCIFIYKLEPVRP